MNYELNIIMFLLIEYNNLITNIIKISTCLQLINFFTMTLESQPKVALKVGKNMFYIQDQNGGTYNGQILFDSSVVSNSSQCLADSEAYIQIPFQISFTGTVAAGVPAVGAGAALNSANGFMCGLRNSYYQLIDSIQDYTNKNNISSDPFTYFFVKYKLINSMSADDLKRNGDSVSVSILIVLDQ